MTDPETGAGPGPKTLRHNPLDDLLAPPAAAPRPDPAGPAAGEPEATPAAPPRPTPTAPRPAPAGGQFLTFRLGDERFAADILQIREILERGAVTRVPRTPRWVHGVMNLRGAVVPVLDLAARLGLEPCTPTRHTCIVVSETSPEDDAAVVGLLVDRVEEVLEVAAERIQPPPDFGTTVHPAFLLGLADTGDALALVLDLTRVLGDPELDEGWTPAPAEDAAG